MSDSRIVLVVDARANVVDALCRSLGRTRWQVLTASDFQQASELVSQRQVSLVIAGARDGKGRAVDVFLKQLRVLQPHVIRVLLAEEGGDADAVSGLTSGIYSEVIPVPWEDGELAEILIRAFSTQAEAAHDRGLSQLLAKVGPLPARPMIYQKVQSELRKGSAASTARIADLIVQDPAMTAQLLRIANAAMFGQRQRIDTVRRAVVVLGLQLTAHLVLLFSASETLQPRDGCISGEGLWTHSLAVGLAASHLQAQCKQDRRLIERAMVGGLLHDVGKLVYAHHLSRGYAEVVASARKRSCSLEAVELEWMGASHAELGQHLAAQWHLPPSVAAAIRWHHQPDGSGRFDSFVTLVQAADAAARELDIGFSGNCEPVDPNRYQQGLPRAAVAAMGQVREALAAFKETGTFPLAWE